MVDLRFFGNAGCEQSRPVQRCRVQPRNASAGQSRHLRRGTAISELAICLPILVITVLASIELCNVKHLKQALIAACYEGALVGSQPRATEDMIVQRIDAVLAARGIVNSTISVDGNGATFDSLAAGDLFTVEVTAPTVENVIGPTRFISAPEITGYVTGHKQE